MPAAAPRRRPPLTALLALLLPLAACQGEPGAARAIMDSPRATPSLRPTTAGPVRGMAAPEGQAYLGIPFAAPAGGARRWAPPEPPAPWDTPRDATRLGPGCIENLSPGFQRGEPSSWLLRGEEDCLNLNVYAPAEARPGERRPVMVWLYGGALLLGSNRQYDPGGLAQARGVVVVAPNYRLGALGFLAHPALRASGGTANAGLLDQQAALRWVRDNIAAFGGDPGNVTLFGESAGAWSTCLQLVSPGAAGLFHRAILQSGPCGMAVSTAPLAAAEASAQAIASRLGCPEGAAAAVAACLRALPPRAVAGAVSATRGLLGPASWIPVHGDATLPQPPAEAFAQGHFHRVPVLLGFNQDEGRLFSALYQLTGALFTEDSLARATRALLADAAPAALAAYPPAVGETEATRFARIVTDGAFACPTAALARHLSAHVPVWAYLFDDPEAPSVLRALPLLPDPGAYHAGEIAYVFGTSWTLADAARFTPAQRALSARMQGAWGDFAAGRPLPWPRFTTAAPHLIRLRPGGDVTEAFLQAAHRCALWDKIFF
ncbi:carboxylesterase family protein [Roseomonas sp. GC11]|uniref:carboxylesterase/lipase family protein n=1 Tax=Roseomonas sp. GC11 TaxID=2950546 RepID=UPI00210DBD62|nr:carboxylesterase family protein [Roseomonas sp. GC11]MCQ4159520.1 carboxylesterase family protein [Roseomonas sp. GC11]